MGRNQKLTDAKIIEIKKYLLENKVKISYLTEKYKVSRQYINNVKNNFKDLNKYVACTEEELFCSEVKGNSHLRSASKK